MGKYSDYKKYDEFCSWDLDKGCRHIVNQSSESARRLKPRLRRQRRARLNMVIKRIDQEFELTDDELIDAYFEQQSKFDEEDVLNILDGMTTEDIESIFKVTKETFIKLAPEIADEMRRSMDKYGIPWEEARANAVTKVIALHKEVKV